MIRTIYNNEGIRLEINDIGKYIKNFPIRIKIIKHVSGEEQWSTDLYDFWFATYPSTEMFDVELVDSFGNTIYTKKWDIFEHGNRHYKSLWLYNKGIMSNLKKPRGLVIGTHDGEFGEWVPIVMERDCNAVLVEGSEKQFNKLQQNYKNNDCVKMINTIVTPKGGNVEFFEGGAGYTNSVVERVIRSWETEEINSSVKPSISITDLILTECDGHIDWLHLDVEGLDAKLIMGIDESVVKLPNLIIFEDNNLSNEEKNEIYNYLNYRGYKLTSEGGICEAIK